MSRRTTCLLSLLSLLAVPALAACEPAFEAEVVPVAPPVIGGATRPLTTILR